MAAQPTASSIDALKDEIRNLEETISERSRILAEKRKEYDGHVATFDEAKEAASEAEQRLAHAQEEFRVAEQTRGTLLPLFERCQQNKDQHQKAEESKRDISRTEQAMREADKRIRELESRLQQVSSEYKDEREKRSLLADRVLTMLEELRSAVEEKVMLTLPIDESTATPHASVSFRAICELSREREVAIAQCARHAGEVAAVVKMKQQRVQELRVESDRDIAALKAVKDEQIKRMVLKFDEERRSIQQDIDAVDAANAELQRQLRQTRHTPAENAVPTIAGAAGRRESARNASAVTTKRTKELEQEHQRITNEIASVTAERQRLLQGMRELNNKIQKKEAEHQRALQNLDNQIHRDKNAAVQLERENQRLEETCDALISAIQASRQAQTLALQQGPSHH
jgi:chromosome segregation ATPase